MNDADHRAKARQLFEEIIRHNVEQTGCALTGWYWYCDDCQVHGTADTEPEAWATARAHEQFKSAIKLGDAECELCVIRIGYGKHISRSHEQFAADAVRPSTA